MMDYFVRYIIAISVISVIICCYDKIAAKSKMWRIPEKVLLMLSAFGGSVAMYITMQTIRHKTRHNKFMVGIPVIILIQIAVIAVFYFKIL
jgi:uncharacterized membrane protein YsdA (DUF1294 family)